MKYEIRLFYNNGEDRVIPLDHFKKGLIGLICAVYEGKLPEDEIERDRLKRKLHKFNILYNPTNIENKEKDVIEDILRRIVDAPRVKVLVSVAYNHEDVTWIHFPEKHNSGIKEAVCEYLRNQL